MRKFKFTISGNEYEVNILNIDDNIAELEVNGTVYQVEIENKQIQTKTPKLIRSVVSPSLESETSTMKTAAPTASKGAGVLKSPLPGTILDVLVREGDHVKIGQRLLILEAMKMENNINSDKEGKIKSIKVRPHDSVLEGDVLLEIGD